LVDAKKASNPALIPPGKHGVGVSAKGYWGDWKLVPMGPGERRTVSFSLKKKPCVKGQKC